MNKLSKTVILFIASLVFLILSFALAFDGNLFVFIAILALCIISFLLFLISLITQLKSGEFKIINKKSNTEEQNKLSTKTKVLRLLAIVSVIFFFRMMVTALANGNPMYVIIPCGIVLFFIASYRKSLRQDMSQEPPIQEYYINSDESENKTSKYSNNKSSSNIDFIEGMIFNNDQITGRPADTDFIENMIFNKTNGQYIKSHNNNIPEEPSIKKHYSNSIKSENETTKSSNEKSSSNIDFIEDMIFNNDQTTGRSADTDFIENMIFSKTNSSISKNTSSTKTKPSSKKQKGNKSKKNIQNIAKLIGFDFAEMQTVKIKNDKRYLLSGDSQYKAKHDIMSLNNFIDNAAELIKDIHPNRIEKDNVNFSHNADALLDGTFCTVEKIEATDSFNVLPISLHFTSNKFYGDAEKFTEDKIAGSIYYSQEGNISHAVINQWYKDNLKVIWVTSSYNYLYIDKIEEFDEKHKLVAIYEYS